MKKYKYYATDKTGRKIKGNFVAENENEMKEMLLKAGYYVIKYREVSSLEISFSLTGKIKVKELSQFCNQFSVMINAGVSIVDAIDVATEQNYSITLRSALKKIKEDLRQGVLLSDAMAKHPKIFPPFFSSMVYIGESAGCLDRVLVTVSEYYTLEDKTKKKIVGALAYPIVLLVLLFGVIIAMMLFVIPRFKDAFGKMDVEMPAITDAIFGISDFMSEYWLIVLAFIAVLAIVLWALHFLKDVQYFYDMLKVKLPIFKKINMAIFTSRFCRSLGLLLNSGSDSLSALVHLKKTITNKYLLNQFERVVDNVRMGMALSAALGAEMNVSPILIQMIVIGEKTGELGAVLIRTAPYFDSESEQALNTITTTIQPVIMVFLGAVIAVIFIAIYSPILASITALEV